MKTRGSDTSQKKYLSIGEVAEQYGISVEVLRKWERDFPRVLQPMRTRRGTRLYDQKQASSVAMICRLLRDEGLTIGGARKRLSGQSQQTEEARQQVIMRLGAIRKQLQDMADELDEVIRNQENTPNTSTETLASPSPAAEGIPQAQDETTPAQE